MPRRSSDRVIDLAGTLLAERDLRISSAEAWAKYTGAGGYRVVGR